MEEPGYFGKRIWSATVMHNILLPFSFALENYIKEACIMNYKFKKIMSVSVALMLFSVNFCYAEDIIKTENITSNIEQTEQSEISNTEKTILLSELAESNSVTFELSGTTIKLSTMYGNADNTENLFLPGKDLIMKVSAENDTDFSVSFSLNFALYDVNGKLVGVNMYRETVSSRSKIVNKTVRLYSSSGAVSAKVMLWNSMQTLKPYCEAISLTPTGKDAHGDLRIFPTTINTEDTIIAKINTVGDVDCFKFTPTKSFTSTLNITGQADFKVYDSFLSFDELVSENGKYSFEANKSYYIKVSGTTENATPVYTFQLDKPSSSLGAEYEQTKSNLTNLTAPKITDVGVNVLNFVKGKYRITLDIDDCIYDSRAENTFFYWESSDGTISGADVNADGSISFVYQANKGTGVRTVRLIIGFGDGLGQVDRKVILLKGNEEE